MHRPNSNCMLVDYDPFYGTATWFEYDEATDTEIIHTTSDVETVLEHNKAKANDPSKPWKGDDMHHVGSIPLVIIEKWLREDGIDVFNKDHWPAVRRKLNDPDYRLLRTSTTQV